MDNPPKKVENPPSKKKPPTEVIDTSSAPVVPKPPKGYNEQMMELKEKEAELKKSKRLEDAKKTEAHLKKEEDERKKKRDEQDKLDNAFKTFTGLRGAFTPPLSNAKFNPATCIYYKKLYKAGSKSINALYTYADSKASVGAIISFIDKTQPKDKQDKLTFLPIKLCDLILFDKKPISTLISIHLFAEKQMAEGIILPLGYVQENFKDVQENAEPDLNLKSVQLEIRFLQEWLMDSTNKDTIVEFRKLAQGFKESKLDDGEEKKKKSKPTKSAALITAQMDNQIKRTNLKEARMFEQEMDSESASAAGLIESSYTSISSSASSYHHREYLFSGIARGNFDVQLECVILKRQILDFWTTHGLITGSMLEHGMKLRTNGRIMIGLPSTRYCVMPGQFLQSRLKPKQYDKDLEREIIIENSKMNYYGFNALVCIYDKGKVVTKKLKEKRMQTKGGFIKARDAYLMKDSKENYTDVEKPIINFHRVELALDLCAFTKSKPEQVDDKGVVVPPEARLIEAYEQFWTDIPSVSNPITAMATMYNQLFDYQFFYNKLLVFQLLCVMSKTKPIDMKSKLKTKYFDLSDFVAFDNKWKFFKFDRIMHVDIVCRDYDSRKERLQKKDDKKKQVSSKMVNTKKEKKQKKQELEEKLAKEKGLKTRKELAEEAKLKDKEAKDKAKAARKVNEAFDSMQKYIQKRKKKEKDDKKEPKADVKDKPEIKVDDYDNVSAKWHVLNEIEDLYRKKFYGPYIIQMNRKNAQFKKVCEYAVVKHVPGADNGCIVFNAAGPMWYTFAAFRAGADFPLENIYYYYTRNTVTTDEDKLKYPDEIERCRNEVKTFYKTCSIFKLDPIDQWSVNKDEKFRAIYDLITSMGMLKEGSQIAFKNTLKALKIRDPVQSNGKKRAVFVENQEIVERIALARFDEIMHPQCAEAALRHFPLQEYFNPQCEFLSKEDQIARELAGMTVLLQECGLQGTNGGMSVRKGWFNGLLELKFRSEQNHMHAINALKEARHQCHESAKQNPGATDLLLKNQVKLGNSNPFIIARKVAFFMNAIATALIGFMIERKMTMDHFNQAQKRILELVKNENPRMIDQEETLQLMSGVYTSKIQQQRNLKLVQELQQKSMKKLRTYFDKKVEDAMNHPELPTIPFGFKHYLAGIVLRLRQDVKPSDLKKKGLPEINPAREFPLANDPIDENSLQHHQWAFCISQVKTKAGLSALYQEVTSIYNPSYLGNIGAECSRKIRAKADQELRELLFQKEDDRENTEKCFMYDRNGHLIVKHGEFIVEKHNTASKVMSWRLCARAAMNINKIGFDEKGDVLVSKLTIEQLEYHGYPQNQIYKGIISSSSTSTKHSSPMKIDAGGEGSMRLIKNQDEEDINMRDDFESDDTKDSDLFNNYDIDSRVKHAEKVKDENEFMMTEYPSKHKSSSHKYPPTSKYSEKSTPSDYRRDTPHYRYEDNSSRRDHRRDYDYYHKGADRSRSRDRSDKPRRQGRGDSEESSERRKYKTHHQDDYDRKHGKGGHGSGGGGHRNQDRYYGSDRYRR